MGRLSTIYLDCEDFINAGMAWCCCSRCHDTLGIWEDEYDGMWEYEPPPNKHGKKSRIIALLCCEVVEDIKKDPDRKEIIEKIEKQYPGLYILLLREEYAKVLKIKRKRGKEIKEQHHEKI